MLYAEMIHGSKGLERQHYIREQVFIKEQGVDPELERDTYDADCDHVLVIEDGEAVGTGRIIIKDNMPLIGRIAVLKEHRGKQYGDLIVRKLVDFGFRQGYDRIEVHAQLPVLKFYEGIGFVPFGETYKEADIEHQSMYITMETFKRKCEH